MVDRQKNIYCISGLGADERVFQGLSIRDHTLVHLPWLSPFRKESMASYANRMASQIMDENPLIIGLSFGGMLAIEMAKQQPVGKIILISAPKTQSEIPAWMRWVGLLKMNRWLPVKSNRFTEKADDRRMGIQTPEEKNMVENYRKNADREQVDWAIDQILNWRNTWVPDQAYHIHGEKDKMFPLKNVRPSHIIAGGTHIMILNKAGEISACIEKILLGI
jgi:pimeloyl-ACP methyl ester carboxylesterase